MEDHQAQPSNEDKEKNDDIDTLAVLIVYIAKEPIVQGSIHDDRRPAPLEHHSRRDAAGSIILEENSPTCAVRSDTTHGTIRAVPPTGRAEELQRDLSQIKESLTSPWKFVGNDDL